MPLVMRVALATVGALVAVYIVQLALAPLEDPLATRVEGLLTNVSMLGAGLIIAARAVLRSEERVAWSLFAAGVLSWGLGDLYYILAFWGRDDAPFPSVADLGYVGFYPLVYAGLMLLLRARLPRFSPLLWIDGVIGALGAAAVGAAFLFAAVVATTEGAPATVATNLAYPLGDLVLLSLVVGALVVTGRTSAKGWGGIAWGLVIFAIADALFLAATAAGGYVHGALFDAGWNVGGLLIAVAAWRPVRQVPGASAEGWQTLVVAVGFALVALAVLVVDHFTPINLLAFGLAVAALLAVIARLVLTFADNVRMLRASRQEALTDPLTGLANRRRLTLDLARDLEPTSGESGFVLALFDLDGFKQYNDTFGHPAGDALLVRLGHKLTTAVGRRGSAYRMGGDEFCVLAPLEEDGGLGVVDGACAALSEQGESFSLECSQGAVLLPVEAGAADEALRIADQRLYRHKYSRRGTASRQTTDALLRALTERHPDLDGHVQGVGSLVEATARRLGVEEAELDSLRLAGELHDIGKMAIPDAILDKPDALDEGEWSFVRRHTLIGERIVTAAPALIPLARLVRSSHERLDGAGYPDGLSGEEIPFGARIVAVCDAFDAMVSDRPYRAAMSADDALRELRRCAGSQFDPDVVEAFCDVARSRARMGSQGAGDGPAVA